MTPTISERADSWRAWLDHPLLLGLLLLAPIVWILWPVPIDETRYLAVAWEMRLTGEFLVPHLNGATYAHKPPLLFWLINAGWLVTGVHAWTARAMTLLCSLVSLLLLERLTLRLTASAAAARASMWLLVGAIYFAAFANAIMFDVPLTTCVLLAVHGIVDLAEGKRRRGVLLTGVAIGLGILVKGPVMLLDIAFVGLAAPWWSEAARNARARYYGGFALAVLLGVAIALAWAIPAALHGGDAYARAIFLNQTFDRIEGVAGASTHGRPWWWYLAVFPLMLLPWPLALRGRWSALRALAREPAMRLALVWIVPTFITFSVIAGKQPHYLLPMVPGVALALAFALQRDALKVRSGLFALALIAVGIGMASLTFLPSVRAAYAYIGDTSAAWGGGVAVIGLALLVGGRRMNAPMWPALATLAMVLLVKLAVVQGPGLRYDMRPIAGKVAEAQQRGQPIAFLGWHHGVLEFAGLLQQPLPALVTTEAFASWAAQHPDGLVVTFYQRFRVAAKPEFTQPFRGVDMSIWTVRDALAAGFVAGNGKNDEADDGADD